MKDDDNIAGTLIEVMSRVQILEKLLIQKGVFSQEEHTKELEDMVKIIGELIKKNAVSNE